MSTRLKARANRAESGWVNFSRRLSGRTAIKKSGRKGRRGFHTAIEHSTVAMIATEETRTARPARRPKALGRRAVARPKAMGLPSEAFAQPGRRGGGPRYLLACSGKVKIVTGHVW
jgi:hypothetical protein